MSDNAFYEAAYDAAEADCKALRAENEQLRKALEKAREDVTFWGNYASDYSKEKHDLDGDLARIDAVLAKEAGNE